MWFVYLIGIILTYNAWKLHIKKTIFLRLKAIETAKEVIIELNQLPAADEVIIQLPAVKNKIPVELSETLVELQQDFKSELIK